MLPAPVIVRVDPLIVPGPLTTWKVTGNPEVVPAYVERLIGESP